MQLFKTEMIQFHPPQHPGAYRPRRQGLRYGCRHAPTRPFCFSDDQPDPGFPAADTIVVGDDDSQAMGRVMDQAA